MRASERTWKRVTLVLASLLFSFGVEAQQNSFGNSKIQITIGGREDALWTISSVTDQRSYAFSAPVFPIEGKPRGAGLQHIRQLSGPVRLPNDVTEYRFLGEFSGDPSLSLELIFRIAPQTQLVRFRYIVHGAQPFALAAKNDTEALRYFSTSFSSLPTVTEVHLSEFNELSHSYSETEHAIPMQGFAAALHPIGPILVGVQPDGNGLVLAYEHGSTVPDAFIEYRLAANRSVALNAVKGNYVPGLKARDFETIWMEAAVTHGGLDGAASEFRDFVLHWMNVSGASRKPLIFYNTWNYQERNRWQNGRPYLESMTPSRMLSEIDAAHRMGIEVFVMDTGWYEKTGDWHVSKTRFPDDPRAIRERLQSYAMKLGLWFNPTAAAVSSQAYLSHKDCVMTWKGRERAARPVWETEESYPMCLVSRYGDAFADELIRIAREYGVRYFKWDGIDQYGCDSPDHFHGTADDTQQERADSYAFQLPLAMARIVQKVTAAYPDAIVDFDVTEQGRAFGLSFLSSGKFFLINNGPYAFNYDLPIDKSAQNWNLFFYPGPARTWICRMPLPLDRWIPSVLLLTHYLPDDPQPSQIVNVGSLILGQDGIWGDLPKVSPGGVDFIASLLSKYKEVRQDMAASFPVTIGAVAGTPEVHVKIADTTGRGAVVIFSPLPGDFTYITRHSVQHQWWSTSGTQIEFDESGHALIRAHIDNGAAIVFFGAS